VNRRSRAAPQKHQETAEVGRHSAVSILLEAGYAPIRSRRMPVKKKKAAKPAAVPEVELIVRRSAIRRFDKLKQATATLPALKVSWDRRTNDAAGDTPQTERRQKPPFTWDVADFVVVEKPAGRAAPNRTRKQR
jgi:hypothetical protein